MKDHSGIEPAPSQSRRWGRGPKAWDGQERRAPGSVAARELAQLKAQADMYEARAASPSGSKRKRRKAERSLEVARKRERQLLEMLGAAKHDG